MDSIIQIMNRDHGNITKLLIRLEKTPREEAEMVKANFNEFKWELERHFVTEEKAIFIFLDEESAECHGMMLDLLKEHEVILKMLKGLEMTLAVKDELDLEGFVKMLSKHRDYEDEVFYPRLENELSPEQQKEVIKGIRSPV
jgi:hemerythrin-like domain-containing protein